MNWRYPEIDEQTVQNWLRLLVERHSIPRPRPRKRKPRLLTNRSTVSLDATLTNKVCIITGASEGIGESIGRALALEGARVLLAARQKDKLDGIIESLKQDGVQSKNVISFKCDITDRTEVQQMVAVCLDAFARIDVLVNCAGCMYYCLVKKGYTAEWKRQIDVNCHGTTNVVGEVIPQMIKQNFGHIVNVNFFAFMGIFEHPV